MILFLHFPDQTILLSHEKSLVVRVFHPVDFPDLSLLIWIH